MRIAVWLVGCVAPSIAVLSAKPPMGWMSWEIFRCQIDCATHPDSCIDEYLYKTMADQLVSDGYLDVGYDTIHIDDCWEQKDPPRDAQGRLQPDQYRFPLGFKALADYMHAQNVKFGIYSDAGNKTCGGYPGSYGYEEIDAKTFAEWGVDYLKLDGCYNNKAGYVTSYPAMGDALVGSGRDIVYSCSWPAYLGSNETAKPFPAMIAAHCNLWRNWDDIQDNWNSLQGIINHWGNYTQNGVLQKYAGPGHWHDPDMLLIGTDGISVTEGQTQLAIWSIVAAPLIMGNDLRTVSAANKATLLNKEAVAVDQDALGKMGGRVSDYGMIEVWARELSDGMAVVLLNKNDAAGTCTFNSTTGYYPEACGGSSGDISCFSNTDLTAAQQQCCDMENCVTFSFNAAGKSGCFKNNDGCGTVTNSAYNGYTVTSRQAGKGQDITFQFSQVGWSGPAAIRDIYKQSNEGTHDTSYTASNVPAHGVAFLKLTKP